MAQKQHLLLVKIPPGKNEEASFEQMLENIYETMTNASVAFEVVSMHQHIYFYVRVETKVKHLIEGQIYGQYPDAEMFEVKDYVEPDKITAAGQGFACAEVVLERSDIYPIKDHRKFEGDSLAGIFRCFPKALKAKKFGFK